MFAGKCENTSVPEVSRPFREAGAAPNIAGLSSSSDKVRAGDPLQSRATTGAAAAGLTLAVAAAPAAALASTEAAATTQGSRGKAGAPAGASVRGKAGAPAGASVTVAAALPSKAASGAKGV
ncbi:hypothetical protein Esti_001135 [Eimeria stiedai]